MVESLRYRKMSGTPQLPLGLEIAFVPPMTGGRFPGIFLFGESGRMVREVRYLPTDSNTYVGSLEQMYFKVAVGDDDVTPGTLFQEVALTNMLSVLASMTPFSDFNQSPRNMYQCQMAKQTMGTPMHSYVHRTDNKIYRLQTPQIPLVRTEAQENFHMNDYPTGINAVVAVISYTGYDMEDAMIINKSAYERGFAFGNVYKTEKIDLRDSRAHFYKEPSQNLPTIDDDGLP